MKRERSVILVKENLGEEFFPLLVEPGISTRVDQFVEFAQDERAENMDLGRTNFGIFLRIFLTASGKRTRARRKFSGLFT